MIKSLYPIFQKWSVTGSIYIISDTHFEDEDCKLIDEHWLNPNMAINILKKRVHKNDTLIHLGDVGNPDYIDQLKCYKVLITGNHDVLSKVASHFDEVYDGPLFIADRILLSHEPIYGLEKFCTNIHGHNHSGTIYDYDEKLDYITHINMASNVCNYIPMNLGAMIKNGLLSKIENYHRITIDTATEKKQKKEEYTKYFGEHTAEFLTNLEYKECKMNNRFLTHKTDCKDCQYKDYCKAMEYGEIM